MAFTADAYLLQPTAAEALKISTATPLTIGSTTAATPAGTVTISIHGSVPAEQWNRPGTRQLVAELERILQELGLADRLQIEPD